MNALLLIIIKCITQKVKLPSNIINKILIKSTKSLIKYLFTFVLLTLLLQFQKTTKTLLST